MPTEQQLLIKDVLIEIGSAVCDKVRSALMSQSADMLTSIFHEGSDDTIYKIDRDVEDVILPILERYAYQLGGLVVLAEGFSEDPAVPIVLPYGMDEAAAAWRLILDPIDGTRCIMYDKRSAFFLAGAAPNKGEGMMLSDIEVAVMTELPTSRAYLADTFWAIKGEGVNGFARNLFTQEFVRKLPKPSTADTIIGGFAQLVRFFPPGRDILAAIEDELIATLHPDQIKGRAIIFEDQYISTGGQLYEVLVGHDRMIADLRARLYPFLSKRGVTQGHVCHPYDACTFLIGQEAGLEITDCWGQPFDAPFDLLSDVGFVIYANSSIRRTVEPQLLNISSKYGL